MIRRTLLALATGAAVAAMLPGAAFAQEVLKFGASAPKSGPLAGGAAVSHWPAIQLWVHDVNERGGIDVGGTKRKVEVIETLTTRPTARRRSRTSSASSRSTRSTSSWRPIRPASTSPPRR